MDEIRKRYAALLQAWSAAPAIARAAAAPTVLPLLDELDRLIQLLEEHHGH